MQKSEDKETCKQEADKIVAALKQMVINNWGKGSVNSPDGYGGYWCWDWTKAMLGTIEGVGASQWKCKAKAVLAFTKDKDGKIVPARSHYYVQCTACGTDRCIDDGYLGGGNVHIPPWPENVPTPPGFSPWYPMTPDGPIKGPDGKNPMYPDPFKPIKPADPKNPEAPGHWTYPEIQPYVPGKQ